MAKRRKQTRKVKKPNKIEASLLHKSTKVATTALAKLMSKVVPARFILVWSPGKNSPLSVKFVKVGGAFKTPLPGIDDADSPFVLDLGSYEKGKSIQIAWAVRTYTELNGMRAFAEADGAQSPVTLGTKQAMSYGEAWEATASFAVP